MIRKFTKKDQDPVLSFIKCSNHLSFPNHGRVFRYKDVENILKNYSSKRDYFAVLEKDDEIVGTVALKEDDDTVGFVRRFYVHPDIRSKGYGSSLINYILERAYHFGFKKLIFRCTDNMVAAIFLLTKKGFTEQVTFFNQNCRVIILEKTLKQK